MIRSIANLRRWIGHPRFHSGIRFLPNFVFAKLAIYFAPLAIAAVAQPKLYAAIELAQSIGLLSIGLIASAPLSGITQRYLVGKHGPFGDLVAVTLAMAAATGLAATGIGWAFAVGQVELLILASLTTAVLHNVAGVILRTLGRRSFASWSDGTAMLVPCAIVALLLVTNKQAEIAKVTVGYLLIAGATLVGSIVALAKRRRPALKARLLDVCRIGLPMALVSVTAVWLGVSGRIIIGLLNTSALPAFGIAFRVAGLTLGLQQLSTTALFVRLYSSRTRAADSLLGNIYAAVAAMSLSIAILGGYLPKFITINALAGGAIDQYKHIVPLAALQIFYWIGYALLQLRVNRSHLAGRSIAPTALVMAAGLALIFGIGLFVSNDIVLLCWLIAAHAAALFAVNVVMLARRGLPHRRVAWVGLIGGAALALVAAIISVVG